MRRLNFLKEKKKIISFIKKTAVRTGKKSITIGVSGGIDSAVSLTLATLALGKNNIYVLQLPYKSLSKKSISLGKKILDLNCIPEVNRKIINIKNIVDTFFQNEKNYNLIRKGNIMARVRMIYLFDESKKRDALVCGTENRSEHLLGYFTRFGDEASDLEPIIHLYKTEIYGLARELSIPSEIINAEPTADLWKGQTDEQELGFTYQDADETMYWYIDKKFSKEQIINKGLPLTIVEKVIKKVEENRFKHKVPYKFTK